MGDEQNKGTGSKAVGIAGGGGAGAILMHLADMINADYRNLYIAVVPVIAVMLSELFTFISALVSLEPQRLRFNIWLFFNKRRLKKAINNGNLPPELLEQAEIRYGICMGIEAGIYKPEDYWKHVEKTTENIDP
ncbi:hypothetical protein [Proteus sp. fly-1008]|uniref:hypothetical protein n=1 Tax=Proteus sp. fly-1008 TaxID=3136672 RepID=UPI0032DA654F